MLFEIYIVSSQYPLFEIVFVEISICMEWNISLQSTCICISEDVFFIVVYNSDENMSNVATCLLFSPLVPFQL